MVCELVMGSLFIVIYVVAIIALTWYQGRKFKEELRKIKGEL